MKGEVKFRGQLIDGGEWAYGSLVKADKGFCGIATYAKKYHDGKIRAIIVEVDPATVGQYTGLKDENGVEIYEGDVFNGFGDGIWGIVEWDEYLLQFQCSWSNMPTAANICSIVKLGSHIIGNIHDNPELLKGCSK